MENNIIAKDTDCIPEGMYCYEIKEITEEGNLKTNTCPYWSIDDTEPEMNNGYCAFLEEGDWEMVGMGLLWDGVKECGVKEDA